MPWRRSDLEAAPFTVHRGGDECDETIEHGHRFIVIFPIKKGRFIETMIVLVCQRVTYELVMIGTRNTKFV